MKNIIKYLWILLLFYLRVNDAKRNYKIDVTYSNLTVLQQGMLKSYHIALYKQPPYNYLTGDLTFYKDITNFDIRVSFDMLRKDNTKINIMKFDLDGCQFLESAYSNFLVKLGTRELLRVSNLPRKCPVVANTKYVIANYTVRPDDFPPYVPEMNWIMTEQFWIKDIFYVEFIIKGNVKKIK